LCFDCSFLELQEKYSQGMNEFEQLTPAIVNLQEQLDACTVSLEHFQSGVSKAREALESLSVQKQAESLGDRLRANLKQQEETAMGMYF
jgi:hypothetical protein